MSRCAPRKHATEARVAVAGGGTQKITVFCFTCAPCGIFAKSFASKAQRDKLAAQHK